MCGITGIITKKKLTEENLGSVKLMNEKLFHRGPNSEGGFTSDHVAVFMRRLSIIDIDGGGQPLWNEDNSISLVANGEIYNFIELREELEKRGHGFKTKSDCETIIHAYEEYGEDFIQKLRGMFAFCLYDSKNKKVILARDRLGEKPLYLYKTDFFIAFSSEFKSINTLLKPEERIINPESINLYFHYQYIPEPMTMFEKIIKLPRASILSIDIETFSVREKIYWNIEPTEIINSYLEKKHDPEKSVRSLLNDIEKIIIRSDVPIGVCLSSGIDSSLIAVLSKKYSDKKINTLSVGYPDHPHNDERKEARILAENLDMSFHDIPIFKEEFLRDFEDMIKVIDDPIADIAGYGYYRLSKTAKEKNIPVLFVGFGGDELFWGYEWVRDSVVFNKLKHGLSRLVLLFKLMKYYMAYFKRTPFTTLKTISMMSFGKKYIFYELVPGFSFVQTKYKKIFTKRFRSETKKEFPASLFNHTSIKNPEIDSCTLLYDLWMTGNCIPLGDRLSMAHSIEMRLPLLDYKLVEEILSLRKKNPGDYLLGYKKWLIEGIKDIVPSEIINRKKKGFTPPTTAWIQELVRQNEHDLLHGFLVENDIINESFVKKMIENIRANKEFLYKMLVLEKWIRIYNK